MHQIIALAVFGVSGCSGTGENTKEVASNETAVPVSNVAVAGPGNEALASLTAHDIAVADLPGELACGFADRSQNTLVYASGDVQADDDAVGLAKIGGSIKRVTSPGGFNALVQGPTLASPSGTVAIRISDGPTASGESPPRLATVTLARPGEADASIDGTWTCGP
ncbi:MAG: hypothetical protein PGN21_07000 [Sphingomonas paucimobilis]